MVRIGEFNRLRVARLVDFGAYLTDGRDEILIPKKFLSDDVNEGDSIRVFVYKDNEARLIATTQIPYTCVDQIASLKVVANGPMGAFLDWGLDKDLLVPNSEQREKLIPGDMAVVWVYVDERSGRIVATTWLKNYISMTGSDYKEGDEVEIVVAEITEIGYKVVVDNEFWGLIYKNEVFQPIHIGDRLDAYVKEVREDGKLDISLQAPNKNQVEGIGGVILAELEANDGKMPYGDRTDADTVYAKFKVSKKVYKRALGMLMKAGKIKPGDFETILIKKD